MAAPLIEESRVGKPRKVARPKAAPKVEPVEVEPVKVDDEFNATEFIPDETKTEAEALLQTDAEAEGKVEPKIDPMKFVYKPTSGDDRSDIVLPLDFSKPDFNNAADRIWLFDLGDLPAHERMWVWLRRAQVSRMTAHRVVALPLDEQVDCIEGWLSAAQGVGAGESSSSPA